MFLKVLQALGKYTLCSKNGSSALEVDLKSNIKTSVINIRGFESQEP